MINQSWEHLTSVLVDTGIFIHWFHGDRDAQRFFRDPERTIYYAKVTRKELLREPIRTSEATRIKAFLNRFRLINPDDQIAARFSELLEKYAYLRAHPPGRPYCCDRMGKKSSAVDDQCAALCPDRGAGSDSIHPDFSERVRLAGMKVTIS